MKILKLWICAAVLIVLGLFWSYFVNKDKVYAGVGTIYVPSGWSFSVNEGELQSYKINVSSKIRLFWVKNGADSRTSTFICPNDPNCGYERDLELSSGQNWLVGGGPEVKILIKENYHQIYVVCSSDNARINSFGIGLGMFFGLLFCLMVLSIGDDSRWF